MARQPTPCPSCGKGKREVQLVVQARFLSDHKTVSPASTVTVCASCAGSLRAELTVLLEGAVS